MVCVKPGHRRASFHAQSQLSDGTPDGDTGRTGVRYKGLKWASFSSYIKLLF